MAPYLYKWSALSWSWVRNSDLYKDSNIIYNTRKEEKKRERGKERKKKVKNINKDTFKVPIKKGIVVHVVHHNVTCTKNSFFPQQTSHEGELHHHPAPCAFTKKRRVTRRIFFYFIDTVLDHKCVYIILHLKLHRLLFSIHHGFVCLVAAGAVKQMISYNATTKPAIMTGGDLGLYAIKKRNTCLISFYLPLF